MSSMNMSFMGKELTLELAREIYSAGWIDGYCSEDVGPFGVNRRIDSEFVRWMTVVPEPTWKALPWTSTRPYFDEHNPDVSHLFM